MPHPTYAALNRPIFFGGHKYDMKTFHEYIEMKIKEGLWLNDKKAVKGQSKRVHTFQRNAPISRDITITPLKTINKLTTQ